ncbi:bacteriophage antitermination protein Q [Citrobacter freundii]|uniref:bacteriophage antitermination protein Q n=1 Tax=Citrobacter freundii TaxID=546 RepID=UPI001AD20F3C|nr:bacteriophage antitermination protein Q [Citrobacter freundii]MDH0215524.1 bacteriophage antitermination protein Q [Citrobacter freundii]MDH0227619.1 bacteriophage antitermination protein Q [Citrobacter freundii]MDH0244082.1 bacteriophage antitermination protein Q [Citrobacter freundii]MDH0984984.1 bacteriophage antitermination protein Q [Citrobacter freundii]MDH1348530.1 bacteriophage antitermination protein Q [Citrobacter freundii]
MNSQQLEYVRQQLIVATADLSGATKGQLVAFAENAQFTATARSRGRKKVYSEVKQRMVNPDGPPMSGNQSRAKGSSIALVLPVEYSTASWRRALLSLEEHQKAWLLWNYSDNIRWEHQVAITQWAWAEFREQLGAKKVAGKTMERLKKLIWLAAQDVKAELSGRETYEYQKLAELAGVAKSTWTETYLPHWLAMRNSFKRLDSGALISVTRSRSQQKATNLDASLAKPN